MMEEGTGVRSVFQKLILSELFEIWITFTYGNFVINYTLFPIFIHGILPEKPKMERTSELIRPNPPVLRRLWCDFLISRARA